MMKSSLYLVFMVTNKGLPSLFRHADFPLFSGFFLLFLARSVLRQSVSRFPFSFFFSYFIFLFLNFLSLFVFIFCETARTHRFSVIFSYFIFLFLNFLSLFVFIFCETACTRRFSVIFAKVQWHPCLFFRI